MFAVYMRNMVKHCEFVCGGVLPSAVTNGVDLEGDIFFSRPAPAVDK